MFRHFEDGRHHNCGSQDLFGYVGDGGLLRNGSMSDNMSSDNMSTSDLGTDFFLQFAHYFSVSCFLCDSAGKGVLVKQGSELSSSSCLHHPIGSLFSNAILLFYCFRLFLCNLLVGPPQLTETRDIT